MQTTTSTTTLIKQIQKLEKENQELNKKIADTKLSLNRFDTYLQEVKRVSNIIGIDSPIIILNIIKREL